MSDDDPGTCLVLFIEFPRLSTLVLFIEFPRFSILVLFIESPRFVCYVAKVLHISDHP